MAMMKEYAVNKVKKNSYMYTLYVQDTLKKKKIQNEQQQKIKNSNTTSTDKKKKNTLSEKGITPIATFKNRDQ